MDVIHRYMQDRGLSQKEFADLVGVTQSMVSQWITGERPIGAERAGVIEKKTRGAIKRHELRPDIFDKRVA